MSQGSNQKQVDEQAREWFMLRSERTLQLSETQAFEQWRAVPEHLRSYRQLENISASLVQLVAAEGGDKLRAAGGLSDLFGMARLSTAWFDGHKLRDAVASLAQVTRPQMGFALTFCLSLGLWFGLAGNYATTNTQTYVSEVAQDQVLHLDDGSEVTLAAGSRLESHFSAERRDVTLLHGQAFFSVAKDAQRPFFVTTDSATIRVVGTRFDVRRDRDRVKVSVEEGIVDVIHRAGENTNYARDEQPVVEPVRLLAGQQVKLDEFLMSEVASVGVSDLASWRDGKLVYHNARLSEVVADVNRYRHGHITLGATHLDDLRVTASFSVDQVGMVISMLEQSLPVSVFYEANDRVTLWPKRSVK